jgi:two-component system nitrate/nitrite response regulator NarL
MDTATPLKVLLLEDQALVRAGMKELIQITEPRAQIDEASSFEEAVRKLDERTVDIAFLDFELKGEKTGLDVLKHIREAELDTRAIMLSGSSEKALVIECINAGACGYIPKDMESDGVFRRALDTVFQGGIFLPATVMGRGGHTPEPSGSPRGVPAESLGVHGRALEVLYYLCQGLPNKAIANKMGIEEGTIRKDYVPKIFRLFKVSRRTELVIEVSRRCVTIPNPSAPIPLGTPR